MISLSNISVGYSGTELVTGANAEFAERSVNLIIGRNGTGKSTILRSMMGICPPLSGHIVINGTDIFTLTSIQRARLIASVTTARFNVDSLRVKDIVALGRAPYTNWIGKMQKEDTDIVFSSLEKVGMENFSDRSVGSLSDGEYQKTMIARALAQQTPVIILDEPTAFLDIPTRFSVCRLLWTLAHDNGKCIVYSTHDIDSSLEYSDSVSIIEDRRLESIPSSQAGDKIKSIFKVEP